MKWTLVLVLIPALVVIAKEKSKPKEMSALDRYIEEAVAQPSQLHISGATPGSLWSPVSRLGDLARDLRASQVDELVTILVVERASATAKGATQSARKSTTKNSIGSFFGPAQARLSDLAKASGETQLDGQGTTSRESVFSTTLAARVTHVLPSGYLVIEGVKDTLVNSERQMITVRGVVRPNDISPGNAVRSDRIAQLEVRINGKGVVGDAIRRPFFLYRLLMGLLPF